jgi:hypothetical protein
MRAFNEIEYIKEAEKVGFTRAQSEFQANELRKIADEFFTKKELRVLYENIQKDFQILQYKLLIKFGGLVVACTGLLSYLIKH